MFWQEADLFPGQYGENENESLQTDIQRFLAIIGFCLMAVFALVQAIPVIDPQQATVIRDLRQDTELQEKEFVYPRSEGERRSIASGRTTEYESMAEDRQEEIEQTEHPFGQPKPEGEGKKPAEKKDLYVAFESDRIFLDLLAAGKVHLFIQVIGMKPGFQVIKKERRIEFVPKAPHAVLDLWEVKENMVPLEILDAFKTWTTLSSRRKMLIVGLTPDISGQIRDRNISGGRLIIREAGRVSYSPGAEENRK